MINTSIVNNLNGVSLNGLYPEFDRLRPSMVSITKNHENNTWLAEVWISINGKRCVVAAGGDAFDLPEILWTKLRLLMP